MLEIPRALLTSLFAFISVYLLVSLFCPCARVCVCVCECLVAKLNDLLGWARNGAIPPM